MRIKICCKGNIFTLNNVINQNKVVLLRKF